MSHFQDHKSDLSRALTKVSSIESVQIPRIVISQSPYLFFPSHIINCEIERRRRKTNIKSNQINKSIEKEFRTQNTGGDQK
ncbi:hypothetical protein DTO212C5_2616 [Paecilomyces variotii]|nr:hypothetical protein DTO212C5_2616 [Paecilomyces variotii]